MIRMGTPADAAALDADDCRAADGKGLGTHSSLEVDSTHGNNSSKGNNNGRSSTIIDDEDYVKVLAVVPRQNERRDVPISLTHRAYGPYALHACVDSGVYRARLEPEYRWMKSGV